MNGGLLYLDSSALVKFVLSEPETDALVKFLTGWPERISSVLARVEVLRAVRRAGEGRAACGLGEGALGERTPREGVDAALD